MRSRVRFPALPWEFSLKGKIPRGDHGLGRLVEFRFKAPPGTTSSSITTHTPSGQRNCASWASKPQKSVTLLPCPGGRTTKPTKDMCWHGRGGGNLVAKHCLRINTRSSCEESCFYLQNYHTTVARHCNTNTDNQYLC